MASLLVLGTLVCSLWEMDQILLNVHFIYSEPHSLCPNPFDKDICYQKL